MAESVCPFKKVETSVDFPALEREVLKFWDEHGTFERRRQLNRGKPRWSFLDGPITANNPMGVHHAWGRTYKDVYNRYFAMTGHELRYQNGFDCQGLWVEVEVEKELQLRSKRDIENLVPGDPEASIARFVQACKDRVNKYARIQTEQSIRLGYWMDWDRTDADWAKRPDDRKSYFTMSEVNNYTIWRFLKKCHEKGLIYRGYDVMPWCGRCGVGISEQEMKEGYKLVEHKSIFVKFPLKNRPGENLLVWTTTPWTLTSNVGAAVNPDLTYLKVKVRGEVYYVAKGAFKLNRMESAGEEDDTQTEPSSSGAGKKRRDWLEGVPFLTSIEQHFKAKAGKGESYEIVGEVKGSDLIGLEYLGPFDELPAQQQAYGFPQEVAQVVRTAGWCPGRSAAQSHRVISGGSDVSETEGTGIVHTAPGCGQIDYLWGQANGLPPVAPIDDAGVFLEGFGPLTGCNAADPATADIVCDELRKKDRLFTTERYVHRYPHCWRCKTELLYRLVDEWFIHMGPRGDLEPKADRYSFRAEVAKVVNQVTFLPESINGRARELDWLKNMGDWMISKKRYWGLCLPIWVDEEDPTQFEVIGSREELHARAVKGWDEFDGHTPHRPWLDRVKIRNPRTGRLMSRIPDVGNPWLDAGIVAFSTLRYDTDREYWRKWYPADFITESFPGQFRNWFYALLAMSTMMSDGLPPFRTLLGHGNVRDQFGHEMHKSAGNAVEFVGAVDDGFELFHDIEPHQEAKVALDALPRKYLSTRETIIERNCKTWKRVYARYHPVGADVIRWFYCRANPAQPVNFGPEPTDDIRSKFFFKLWNTYAFFVTCAIGDGFDPLVPEIPIADRPDFDRWLLSRLHLLVKEARPAFESYNVMAFAHAAERFVDEHLSNWYVRRNKDRFWSKTCELDDAGKKDKLAAYQTLYTTLTTLCQLLAPCIPFVAEAMWKNLRSSPESVHLCEYPSVDESLIDAALVEEMEALTRVVTLGSAARQSAKIKVRQPLAELVVSPGTDAERRAILRFADVLRDELNVKQVRLHDAASGPLVWESARLNKKVAGAKIGARLKEVEAHLAMISNLATEVRHNPVEVCGVMLEAADFTFETVSPPGWAGAIDRKTQVAISTTISHELKLEGLMRDVIRQVQEARKAAGLELLDKITLHLHSPNAELNEAIRVHQVEIAKATQAEQWSPVPLSHPDYTTTIKIDSQPLTIALSKLNKPS